jgi:NitT/TauT family transport system substrate-binding protein
MVVNQGIMPEAALVKKAIPNCNIVYIDGTEMKNSAQPFLNILLKANPKSIGGKMPNEDFYYTK